MNALPFDAVLCDLDGVIRLWDPDGMTSLDRAWGLGEGTLAAAAFDPQRVDPAVTGLISDQKWRSQVAEDLADACGSLPRAQALIEAWAALVGQADAAVLALLAAVRRCQVPVVLISNATTRLEEDLATMGLTEAFDAVVNTARVGITKPDPRVFAIAAQLAGTTPDRCLFIDDTLGHVTAARTLGMEALHYEHVGQLRAVLGPLAP